jgi:phospholipid/cholesterol/gamma-HCH transport system substrate-binding protein
MTIRLSKEFKVGMYLVLAIFLLYWGVNYLKGNDVFARDTVFYAIYDNTEGLAPAKSLEINGYQIGLIDNIYFHPDQSGRLIVKLKQLKPYPIPKNSIARIHSAGFLGEKNIQLILGDSKELAQSGDTLISGFDLSLTEEVSAQVAPIKAKAETLLASLDTVVGLLSGFLSPNSQKNFEKSFESLKNTFANLEKSSTILNNYLTGNEASFQRITANLESISRELSSNSSNITRAIKNVANITDTINQINIGQTMKKVDHAVAMLDEVMFKINSGVGTTGELVNNNVLYENLEDATYSLNRLLLDIKYNPNKYFNVSLFGNTRYYTEEEILEIEKEMKKRRNLDEIEERDIDSKRN